MPKGTIRRLISDRGFGFINTDEGKELFFHRNELLNFGFHSSGIVGSAHPKTRLVEIQS